MNSTQQPIGMQNLPENPAGSNTAVTQSNNSNQMTADFTKACDLQSERGLKPLKQKRCKCCKTLFQPIRALQAVCTTSCAIAIAEKKRTLKQAKERRETAKADRVKREKLKTKSDWTKEAQIEFNKFIRLRDSGRTCISCGADCSATSVGGAGDAGHFRSRGSAPHLRFDERNTHMQCKRCNRYLAGNVANYRNGLIERIGLSSVEELESDQTQKNYTIDDLKEIKAKYKALARELERAING